MDKNRNIDSFEQSLRQSLQGAEIAPSEQNWSRIEASLDSARSRSPWLLVASWSGAVAASVAIAIAANILFSPTPTEDPYQIMLSSGEFTQLESLPILLDPVRLSDPKFVVLAQQHDSTLEATELLLIEDKQEEVDEQPQPKPTETEREHDNKETNRGDKQNASTQPSTSVVISNTAALAIDSKKILGKKKTRRYATSAAGAALLATGASLIDYSSSPTVSAYDSEINNHFELFDPEAPTTDNDESLQDEKGYNPSLASHSLPISYSVTAAYKLGKRWSLESGINYTRLDSEITMVDSQQPLSQVVQFIGLPLRVSYEIYSINRFSLYAAAGGQLERCISSTLDSDYIEERDWHISADGALGAQYRVCKWLGIYAEPEVGYYFTPTTLNTIRTGNPFNFNLNVGVRILLGGE